MQGTSFVVLRAKRLHEAVALQQGTLHHSCPQRCGWLQGAHSALVKAGCLSWRRGGHDGSAALGYPAATHPLLPLRGSSQHPLNNDSTCSARHIVELNDASQEQGKQPEAVPRAGRQQSTPHRGTLVRQAASCEGRRGRAPGSRRAAAAAPPRRCWRAGAAG
jgi:hypothetical protein